MKRNFFAYYSFIVYGNAWMCSQYAVPNIIQHLGKENLLCSSVWIRWEPNSSFVNAFLNCCERNIFAAKLMDFIMLCANFFSSAALKDTVSSKGQLGEISDQAD